MLFSSHIFTPLEITPMKYLQHDLLNDGSYCVKTFMFWTILQILAHILAILYENSRLYRMNGSICLRKYKTIRSTISYSLTFYCAHA
jgi:hypothetical protein